MRLVRIQTVSPERLPSAEIIQSVGGVAVLPEDLRPVLSTHTGQLTAAWDSRCLLLASIGSHKNTSAHTWGYVGKYACVSTCVYVQRYKNKYLISLPSNLVAKCKLNALSLELV